MSGFTLFPEKINPTHPVEHLLVSVGSYGGVSILGVSGVFLLQELDIDRNSLHDQLSGEGLLENPGDGIWVWEGVPNYSTTTVDYITEVDGIDFSNGIWREPTEHEWARIQSGSNIWPTSHDEGEGHVG